MISKTKEIRLIILKKIILNAGLSISITVVKSVYLITFGVVNYLKSEGPLAANFSLPYQLLPKTESKNIKYY